MKDINQEEWRKLIANDENAIILDVRTKEEVTEEGIIPGALHYNIYEPETFMNAVNCMDASKNYYVYCRAGSRSAQACQIMNQLGLPNTYNLLGGFMEWEGETTHI
ncbi:rhodanese-like domain-containing protein [Nonlabens tegetincola]|uniref:rhodanese-like domain-containing protein n=1 Tax=Nonlabens tegetincola TaxID=323273 RepID=UPI000CF55490|nr:rhodanese-like domain-containing protein [Nonlabens tegetincola]PQJ17248.1 rhodanese [Nonlabens tegetincola]